MSGGVNTTIPDKLWLKRPLNVYNNFCKHEMQTCVCITSSFFTYLALCKLIFAVVCLQNVNIQLPS